MGTIKKSFPADPGKLPHCAPGTDKGELVLSYLNVAWLASAPHKHPKKDFDNFVWDHGVPDLCDGLIDPLVQDTTNPYGSPRAVEDDSAKLLARHVSGFAVIRGLHYVDPKDKGGGELSGYVVSYNPHGVPRCALPFDGKNRSSVLAWTHKTILGTAEPTKDAKEQAWSNDLHDRVCNAISDDIPEATRGRL